MKAIKTSAILISLFFLIGCSTSDGKYTPPKFAHVNKDVSFEYMTEDLPFTIFYNLYVDGNQIVVVARNPANQTYAHIYDYNSGKHLSSGIKYGEGPDEVLYPGLTHIDPSTGEIHIFDLIKDSHMIYRSDGEISFLQEKHLVRRGAKHSFPIDGETYVTVTNIWSGATYNSGAPRVFIDTYYLDTLARYNVFPLDDSEDRYFMYNNSCADISPDGKHLAIGLRLGCILETFELGTEIRRTGLKYHIKPEVTISKNGNSTDINYDNTIWGFGDIELSDNYIYTSYDGKKENKMHNNIAVFDLTGEPVSITNLGNNDIQQLYADEPNGNLYVAIENESGEIRIIRLKIDDIIPKK